MRIMLTSLILGVLEVMLTKDVAAQSTPTAEVDHVEAEFQGSFTRITQVRALGDGSVFEKWLRFSVQPNGVS